MKNDLVVTRPGVEETVTIRDFGRILNAYRYVVLALPLLISAVALAYVLIANPEWEATGVIQVGQIWQGQSGLAVEAPARTVERLKLRPFQLAVLGDLAIPTDAANPLVKLFTSSLKVRALPNTDLIEIKVRAFSAADATRWLEATVNRLHKVHDELAEPSIARLRFQLAGLNRQIEGLQGERERLMKDGEMRADIGPGNRFAESLLHSNLLLHKEAELRDLELRKIALEEQLNAAKTYPTSLIDRVDVPERAAYPRKALTVVLAAAIGLFLGIVLALFLNSVRVPTS